MAAIRIRPARPEELPALAAIEQAAGRRFVGLGLIDSLLDRTLSLDELAAHQRTGLVLVALTADDEPVGFAVASTLAGAAHLDELDVLPDYGRRGIGQQLVEGVCDWARERGLGAVTLSTFRDIPWNGPFYARQGFATLADGALGPELQALRAREARLGLPIEQRVFMRRDLGADLPPRLVLYDGDCGVCSRIVRWLLDADTHGRLRFAPLAGATADAIRRTHPQIPTDLDAIVYVERAPSGTGVFWRSEAVFRICAALGGRWALLAWLRVLPRALMDAAYDLFARNRHRMAASACPLPTTATAARFLP